VTLACIKPPAGRERWTLRLRPLPRDRAARPGSGPTQRPHPAALDEALPPAEVKCLADRLEIHSTPKHGSWRNMAGVELSVVQRQCLDRRLGDRAAMAAEVATGQRRGTQRQPASSSDASTQGIHG